MRRRLFYLLATSILGLSSCARPAPPLAQTKPAEVIVGLPTKKIVTDYEEFTGRTEAIKAVDVRSRVTGYLEKIHFVDGKDVKENQPLFDIDPKVYQATLDQSIATVNQAKARLDRVKRDYDRLQAAIGTNAVTQEEFDRVKGDQDEAIATLNLAKAGQALAEANYKYTKILAPISGRISRRMIDAGNLVKADDTVLTTIVSLDQMYANFDVDERTLLRFRRLIQEGKVDSARTTDVYVDIGLADEEGFLHKGLIDFSDNKVDPATGTLRVRAILKNENGLFSPGLFVRVRVPVGRPHEAILIPEEALGSDQGLKFVFVVNDRDEVVNRPVKIGQQVDRERVILEGLQPTDRIIISGLQRVRPGAKVTPKTLESAATPKAKEKTKD